MLKASRLINYVLLGGALIGFALGSNHYSNKALAIDRAAAAQAIQIAKGDDNLFSADEGMALARGTGINICHMPKRVNPEYFCRRHVYGLLRSIELRVNGQPIGRTTRENILSYIDRNSTGN